MKPAESRSLEHYLGWLLLALLVAGCVMVMRPFVSSLLWAGVLSFSLWPLHRRLLAYLGGRRTLASALMTLAVILVLLLPFAIVGVTLAENVKELTAATQRWLDEGPPTPPPWLAKVPLVGQVITENWIEFAGDSARLLEQAKRWVEPAGSVLLKGGMKLASGVLDLALSILVAFFLLRSGVAVAERLTTAIGRIAGERGKHLLVVAGKTVRGVVYGILGTALVQAVAAGLGFVIAGVPGAGLLALLTFFLSPVPVGPPLVWLPAAYWLFQHGSPGWGVFLLIWGFGVSSIDNVVKPWLISQGSDLPFLLIFFGVLGGALAFGLIGVFLGPTLLAVGYRLVEEWDAAKKAEAVGASNFAAPKRASDAKKQSQKIP